MWIHWKKKVMKFTYLKKRVVLNAISNDISKCSQISAHKLKSLLKRKVVHQILQLSATPALAMNKDISSLPMTSIAEQSYPTTRYLGCAHSV